MKLKPRKSLPDVGELVVGTVEEVYDYGAYLGLDEYGGLRAFLPWSEVATRAVRRIDMVVKQGQKVVVKVIRVYKKRGQVDVSLKRVMEGERRRKMTYYKRYVKAATLVELLAERLGKTRDQAYEEVVWRLDDAYGDPLTGLEQAVVRGREALEEAGVPGEWIEPLLDLARSHVRVKQVKISGVFTARSSSPDGVKRIREVLLAAKKAADGGEGVKARLYCIGTPRYRIDVYGHDYKVMERVLSRAVEEASKKARELGVELSFERIKV